MRVFIPVLLVCSALCAFAEEISVSPGKGALAAAIESAKEGDTLVLQPGIYREAVKLEKRLTLKGKPGAILDGASDFTESWKSAGGDLADVYTAPVKNRPDGLLVDGKFLAEIRYDRAKSGGDWNWKTLLRKGTPLSGFENVRALWMYHPDEDVIYARFPDAAKPSSLALTWVPKDRPLLEIRETSGVVVEDLTFAHGSSAIAIREGAQKITVRRCKVTSFEGSGIVLTDGASHCTIEDCEITRGAYEEWQPSIKHDRPNYEIWKVHKDVGRYDRLGIELFAAGAGNRILRNKLDRVFDGVTVGDYRCENLDKPLTNPDHGRDTEIAGNTITNTRDSGIELGVGCVNVHVHHNTLERTHGGLRFKAPRIGPVYIHHNKLIDGSPFNIWFSMDASPAEGYVYHNTIVRGGRAALEYSSFNQDRDFGTPKWQFLNNLAIGTEDGFFYGNKGTPKPDFTEKNNVLIKDAEGDTAPAKDAGLDLSKYLNGKPLPGCEAGYFKGKAPDAGAEEK